jgi:exonuclease VII large subunit
VQTTTNRLNVVVQRGAVARKHFVDRKEIAFRNANQRDTERRALYFLSMCVRWDFRRRETARLPETLKGEVARQRRFLTRATLDRLSERKQFAAKLTRVFATINYKAVLARGFALVFDKAGAAITSAEDAALARSLLVRFSDGALRASANPIRSSGQSRKSIVASKQNSLF